MAQAELFRRQERGLRVLSSIAADREQRLDLQLRRALGARAQRFILRHHAKRKVLGDFTRLLDELQRG